MKAIHKEKQTVRTYSMAPEYSDPAHDYHRRAPIDFIGKSIYQILTLVIMIVFAIVLGPECSHAQQKEEKKLECPVYGDYSPSQRWGWYGAKRNIKNEVEAKELLEKILLEHMRIMHLQIGKIREKPRFYEADIIRQGVRIDIIIIDKRSGRIRSAY